MQQAVLQVLEQNPLSPVTVRGELIKVLKDVGLVVDRIVDIVDEKLVVQNPAQRSGVLGSSVVQKRVTDLLDVPSVVREMIPGFAEAPVSN